MRFHEALVEGSGNAFFIDPIRASTAAERNDEASEALREHLSSTLRNITKIRGLLKP